MAATGGKAAIAAPALDPLSGAVSSSLGDTVVAQLVADAGMEVLTGHADDKLIECPPDDAMPDYAIPSVKEGTGSVKTVLIGLRYKHTTTDAALGLYRSSVHSSVLNC
ncbi:hypothetical protein AURDEDRAFT_112698 [Auricularia subglabra TFB-10046 SS5]|nr:hypothetical protein AURDEDRAFT_112698 [Auricularia subglabra TFB-10046 SS5]